jgi:hypothetical protein
MNSGSKGLYNAVPYYYTAKQARNSTAFDNFLIPACYSSTSSTTRKIAGIMKEWTCSDDTSHFWEEKEEINNGAI